MTRKFILYLSITVGILVIVTLFAFYGKDETVADTAGTSSVREFPVKSLSYESIVTHKNYPATVEGIQTVELRPRVSGYLEEIYIDEGASVKKGQPLFRINSDEFVQQVNSAEASVAVAEAQVNTAKMEVEKQRPLVEKGIVSEYTLTAAQYSQVSAEAALLQAEAVMQNAHTNLSYTIVKSPANGIIGTIPYRIGSLVGSSIPDPLTLISDVSEVRVYFAVNEKDFLILSKNLLARTKEGRVEGKQKVNLVLVDGTEYDEVGVIDAVSGLIDASTGSATIRASFKNPDGFLRSGSSASVKIPTHIDSALLVPQSATYELQNKRFIYVVDENNLVHPQNIEVSADDTGQFFIVHVGLKENDRIVLDGINSLQNDMEIKPVSNDLE